VTDAPTIPVSTKENLGDPIDIRVDIIHPKPVVGVAFSAAAVVTTLACHEEAIRGIYKHLCGLFYHGVNRSVVSGKKAEVVCYGCGGLGHYKSNCLIEKFQNRVNMYWKGKAHGDSSATTSNINIYDRTERTLGSSRSYTKTRESQTRRCRRYDQEGYTEGEVEDGVMLKVLPWKGVVCFGKWGKLNPRYVGPFQVLAKVRAIAYKLELPQELSRVYNTFHVSNLKKCYADEPLAVPLDGLHIDDKLHFVEEPIEIMDRGVKRLRQSHVPIVKVRWNSRRGPEFTWEHEDQFRKKYPHLFTETTPSSSAAS
ncbi:putative reverse transcriptase domain-containing protein, partial [Tanacetum coccineum]